MINVSFFEVSVCFCVVISKIKTNRRTVRETVYLILIDEAHPFIVFDIFYCLQLRAHFGWDRNTKRIRGNTGRELKKDAEKGRAQGKD